MAIVICLETHFMSCDMIEFFAQFYDICGGFGIHHICAMELALFSTDRFFVLGSLLFEVIICDFVVKALFNSGFLLLLACCKSISRIKHLVFKMGQFIIEPLDW